ncbi:MAG TPA: 5-formyltetrahydrofolate cyclo-ligase [Bdellovibrionales bacterium]|nr:5-formyltetrahydrofolate cyclo-ligase [Bdellovibrionales bacterium]
MLEKAEIRAKYRRLRESFVASRPKGELESRLAAQLDRVLGQSGVWIGYRKAGSEADPSLAIQKHSKNKWAYPRVEGLQLRFFIPKDDSAWVKGSWGIMEPDPSKSKEIDLNDTAGVLVPGVVFDKKGGRVGSGKGFYDRALSHYRGVKVGVAYSVQIADELPREIHDVTMNHVVTELEIFSCEERVYS